MLHSENGIQQKRAGQAEEYETRRVLLEGHLHIRIDHSQAIDQPLNRET